MTNFKRIVVLNPEHEVKETRNTEFTDRAVNEPAVTEEVELGAYRDVGEVTHSSVNTEILQDPYKSFPSETFDLQGVLTREYFLANILWSEASGSGTILQTFSFPETLFNQSFISSKISDFLWFRGGIRISIRIVSNKFLYGKIYIAWHPDPLWLDTVNFFNDVTQMSTVPHKIISASAGETTTFDIPFVNPAKVITTDASSAGQMGKVYIGVLNPLIDINGTVDTAKILVMGQFVEPELIFPFSTTSAEYDYSEIEFQTESSSGPTLDSEGRHPGSPGYGGGRKTISKQPALNPKKGGNSAIAKESQKKIKEGSISSALETTSNVASLLTNVPLISPYASMAGAITGGLGTIAKGFGLNKPTTTANTQVNKIDQNFGINYGKGLDMAPKAAMDPDNACSTEPNVGGLSQDFMDLHALAGLPTLIATTQLQPNSGTIVIGTCHTSDYCYCDKVAQMFKYWSGGFKFKVYITASTFHSIRLVFWLGFGDGTQTAWQNHYHEFVDVQGDTEYETMLPYLYDTMMQTLATGTIGFNLMCTVISWSQPDDSLSCPIFLNTYKAAASDFQWGNQLEMYLQTASASYESEYVMEFQTESDPRQDFVREFPTMHSSFSGFNHDKFVMGEQFTHLSDMLHRTYSYYTATTNDQFVAYNRMTTIMNGHQLYMGIEAIGNMFFYFWRGSITVRLLENFGANPPNSKMMSYYRNNFASAPMGMDITTQPSPIMELQIPFYYQRLYNEAKYPFLGANDTDALTVNVTAKWSTFPTTIRPNKFFIQKSAGDDFKFFFPTLAPRSWIWVNVPVDQTSYQLGNPALETFLT